ncbi:MAG TPA: hypothetical protein VMG12_36925, partial [Polyangiaceae bacterium]|nr:hypothetical protein [Polyangiaceae bacterium]
MGSSGGSGEALSAHAEPVTTEQGLRYDDSLAPRSSSLLGLARRLVDVGVSDELEEQLALRLRVGNGLAGVNVAVCALIGLQHVIVGRSGLGLGLGLSALSWSSVFVANRAGLHRVSRL